MRVPCEPCPITDLSSDLALAGDLPGFLGPTIPRKRPPFAAFASAQRTPLADDKLGSIAHENGLVTTLAYEDFGPVHSIGVSGASAQQLVYGYDELLNVQSIAETQNGTPVSPSFGFAYDAVCRRASAATRAFRSARARSGSRSAFRPA